ncbi:MAG: hypothetical protein JWP22_411 [Ramlibacter sp.]|jgi:hypothetical protein|nr:hypothetical protein [Ramlibacter sp.]MDB5911736.1 hypothetical protein [Ramlibacter sp.]
MKSRSLAQTVALFVLGVLAGCGGGSESTTPSSSSSGSSSSGGGSCNYPDKITASERAQANSCGIQVSGNYGQADSGLASVIAACQAGEKAKADAYYAGTYQQMVDYARQVSKTLSCGSSSNSPALPNTSTQSYYNFCAQNTSITSTPRWTGKCIGPFKQGESGCPTDGGKYTYVDQYSSLSACSTAAQNWLNTH